jgi:hypothetical protein
MIKETKPYVIIQRFLGCQRVTAQEFFYWTFQTGHFIVEGIKSIFYRDRYNIFPMGYFKKMAISQTGFSSETIYGRQWE